jgi:hypothetical protein
MKARLFNNITDIKLANKAIGHHWFSPSTLRFFKSKVVSDVMFGQYFITRETDFTDGIAFTIRQALPDGQIETIGEFHVYKTKAEAIRALENYLMQSQKINA